MQLKPGFEAEYKTRHDTIWPELTALVKEHGFSDYSIFLDKETLSLFAVFNITDEKNLEKLAENPLMKKWWAYMEDIMETNPDNSPASVPLKDVFYLR